MKKEKVFFRDEEIFFINGEQIKIMVAHTWHLGKDGDAIRDILRKVINEQEIEQGEPEGAVKVRVLLGGNSVCGQENRPDSCLACSELPNCVLDLFYETISKEGKASPAEKKIAPVMNGS